MTMLSVSVTLVDHTSRVIAEYRANGIDEQAASVARSLVGAAAPSGVARARTLLRIAGRLAAWAISVGLEPRTEVVLQESVIERFVTVAMRDSSASARRTARTNLRYLARRVRPVLVAPSPTPLPLAAKAPYSAKKVMAYFALATTQSTEARRQRLTGLLCLGLPEDYDNASHSMATASAANNRSSERADRPRRSSTCRRYCRFLSRPALGSTTRSSARYRVSSSPGRIGALDRGRLQGERLSR